MATQPSLRIGDRERDATAAELREHYAHGRLTLEEFNQRIDAVFAARTQRDLSQITADLPHVRTGGAPLPSARTRQGPHLASGITGSGGGVAPGGTAPGGTAPRASQAVAGSALGGPAPVWPGSPAAGSGWPGSGSGGYPAGWGSKRRDWSGRGEHRRGFGAFITLLSAVASWLLVYDVLLAGWQVPWAGRAGLLIAIFAFIRGLLRRIFGGARGRRMPHRTRRRRC